ncbi:MAG: aminotransferase class I/II-fold pyridoxal phosphate-dependent enzyme [Rhodospirillaceae bacterium]
MALKQSNRGQVPPFIVMDVMRAAEERERAGGEVLHLEVGQPGTGAPKAVIDAAAKALSDDRIGYTNALGLWSLREAVAVHYQDCYGVQVTPDSVVITTGSSGGFVLSFMAAFDAGDRVALASPGYPAYRNILKGLGVEVVDLPTRLEDNFQPTRRVLETLDRAIDGLIIASPSNPAGTMIHEDTLRDLVDHCRVNGVRLISDEIYHGITYGAAAATALTFTRDAVIINSFSKYYSMTGWRLGWMVVPDDLHRPVECLAQNLFISPPAISQLAAIQAFGCREELYANVARYARNRAVLLKKLPQAGFTRLAPTEGAFYIYADVSELTNDAADFCRRMLAETGVAATPGVDFDPARGSKYVRFSFAGDEAVIDEAANRLITWKPA